MVPILGADSSVGLLTPLADGVRGSNSSATVNRAPRARQLDDRLRYFRRYGDGFLGIGALLLIYPQHSLRERVNSSGDPAVNPTTSMGAGALHVPVSRSSNARGTGERISERSAGLEADKELAWAATLRWDRGLRERKL